MLKVPGQGLPGTALCALVSFAARNNTENRARGWRYQLVVTFRATLRTSWILNDIEDHETSRRR
jgi:hypothetical protein